MGFYGEKEVTGIHDGTQERQWGKESGVVVGGWV